MGNSSYTVQSLIDIARSMADTAPVLPTGGAYETVALSAVNDAMTAMLAGSHRGSPFNFKFNRIVLPQFFLNSWQQDYASQNVNIGWLESAGAYNMSSTQQPKPFRVIEVKRDVLITNAQTGNLAKIQYMQNNSLQYGTWGQAQSLAASGLSNPGPSVVYTNPAGAIAMPANPTTQVKDGGGSLWILTTYGTCGLVNPFQPVITATSITANVLTVTAANGLAVGTQVLLNGTAESFLNGTIVTVVSASPTQFTAAVTHANYSNGADTGTATIVPVFPSLANSTIVPTTVTDGTVVWTAVNPFGQGYRVNPMPTQTGPTWLVAPVAQAKIPQFTSIGQPLEPVPDDFFKYLKDGFIAQCYRYSVDVKVRNKFKDEFQIWMESLDAAVRQGSREDDDWGFVPGSNVMDTGWAFNPVNPAMPYGPWAG